MKNLPRFARFKTSIGFRWLAATLALAILAPQTRAQNLVANPSFEVFTTCPTTDGQLAFASPWYSPNSQTPDLLNSCSTLTPDVPINFYGDQLAHDGEGYASAICYGQLPQQFREYCGGQLTSPLVAGNTYDISFWVSLADKSSWAIAEVGMHLNVGPHSGPGSTPMAYTPQLQNSVLLTDKTSWVQISGTYVASGGEDHIALGNFNDNANTTATTVPGGLNNFAVYYFDSISVVDQDPGCATQLVGWSDLPSPATTGYLDVQDVANCDPARTICRTLNPVRALAPFAGGTAYDPRYQTAWVSDGTTLAEYYVASSRACRQRCAPFRAVVSDPNALVSGLTCSDARPRLFQLATRPGLMELTIYDNSGRCPDRPRQCRRSLPAGALAAGIAYDEIQDLLFISVSVPSPIGWSNLLWVMRASAPCELICENRLFDCSRRMVTGLAYDACGRKLYATDGSTTQTIDVIDAGRCTIELGRCCRKQHNPIYRGLAAMPCSERRTIGRSCTNRGCPSCPNMTIGSTGDPAIGTNFNVTLGSAPAGSQAYLILSSNPCTSGVSLAPPLCGILFPDMATAMFFAPVPVNGLSSCTGRASRSIPLAVDARLCGQAFCAQWYVICPNPASFGFGLSNALEFTVGGG